jgi:Ankyrin repeats (many copies)
MSQQPEPHAVPQAIEDRELINSDLGPRYQTTKIHREQMRQEAHYHMTTPLEDPLFTTGEYRQALTQSLGEDAVAPGEKYQTKKILPDAATINHLMIVANESPADAPDSFTSPEYLRITDTFTQSFDQEQTDNLIEDSPAMAESHLPLPRTTPFPPPVIEPESLPTPPNPSPNPNRFPSEHLLLPQGDYQNLALLPVVEAPLSGLETKPMNTEQLVALSQQYQRDNGIEGRNNVSHIVALPDPLITARCLPAALAGNETLANNDANVSNESIVNNEISNGNELIEPEVLPTVNLFAQSLDSQTAALAGKTSWQNYWQSYWWTLTIPLLVAIAAIIGFISFVVRSLPVPETSPGATVNVENPSAINAASDPQDSTLNPVTDGAATATASPALNPPVTNSDKKLTDKPDNSSNSSNSKDLTASSVNNSGTSSSSVNGSANNTDNNTVNNTRNNSANAKKTNILPSSQAVTNQREAAKSSAATTRSEGATGLLTTLPQLPKGNGSNADVSALPPSTDAAIAVPPSGTTSAKPPITPPELAASAPTALTKTLPLNESNKEPNKLRLTEMINAVIAGNLEKVQNFFRATKADINVKDSLDRTALWWAVKYGQTRIAEWLLRQGADPNIANINGINPLALARKEQAQNKRLLELLEKRAGK